MQNLLVLKELPYAKPVKHFSCGRLSAVKYFESLLCFYHRIKSHIVQAVKRSLIPTLNQQQPNRAESQCI